MKKRNVNLLAELANAEFKKPKEGFEDLLPEEDRTPSLETFATEATGDPATGDEPTSILVGDFILNSDSQACFDCQIPFDESWLRLEGNMNSNDEPIHQQDEPDLAIFMLPIPKPNKQIEMTLLLNNQKKPGNADEVSIRMVNLNGGYEAAKAQIDTTQILVVAEEGDERFLTYTREDGTMTTIMNIRKKNKYVELRYARAGTLDMYRASLLIQHQG